MSSNDENDKNIDKTQDNIVIWYVVISGFLILLLGIFGFSYIENLTLSCAFYEAAAVLSTVGASIGPSTESGKIFAGFYALLSITYIIITGYLIGKHALK